MTHHLEQTPELESQVIAALETLEQRVSVDVVTRRVGLTRSRLIEPDGTEHRTLRPARLFEVQSILDDLVWRGLVAKSFPEGDEEQWCYGPSLTGPHAVVECTSALSFVVAAAS